MVDLSARASEQLRRASARTTESIAVRWGSTLQMWIGCGYPKSGTVWLCQLMSNYLGVPYPQNYLLPVAMSSVIHAHWPYDERLPPTAYIVRDGRDVMTSLYFYEMRALTLARNPRRQAERRARYERVLGSGFDPDDIRGNLPRFLAAELADPRGLRGVSWQDHVREWTTERPQVGVVRYEDLIADPVGTFATLMTSLTGEPADAERARLAVDRFDFSRSGRAAGEEDRTAFMRKGVRGDWRNHFTREAREVFDAQAGDVLRAQGYADDGWVDES